MHASLGCGRVENELGLPVLLLHGEIVIHGHRAIRIPVRRRPQPENCVVQAESQRRRTGHRQNGSEESSFQPDSKVWRTDLGHGADYIPQAITVSGGDERPGFSWQFACSR